MNEGINHWKVLNYKFGEARDATTQVAVTNRKRIKGFAAKMPHFLSICRAILSVFILSVLIGDIRVEMFGFYLILIKKFEVKCVKISN